MTEQGVYVDNVGMIVAFVESIKYVGHLLPVAFLRVFIGYYYFNQALLNMYGKFLTQPNLAEDIRSFLPNSSAPEWYKLFLEQVVVPNWQIFAYAVVAVQMVIGGSYIIGYLVRPASLLAIFLAVNMSSALGGPPSDVQSTFLIVLHFTLGWLGAGRCLGLDYFFYKRRRGIWW
ncbi:MAG: DoxX family membrane protein [Bdellovibrionaceae bacterium]|nr:DoxX family membrane protein [Pseudobdellovibrionaceae bacterium]